MTSQPYSAVYVLYPQGLRTGGPEALHQLAGTLESLGVSAYMVPLDHTRSRTPIEYYTRKYSPRIAHRPLDESRNAIVIPEDSYSYVHRFSHAQVFCWWLSIDNSSLFRSERMLRTLAGSTDLRNRTRRIAHATRDARRRITRHWDLRGSVEHLTQSCYAWSFLQSRLNVSPSMLSDYTVFPETSEPHDVQERENGLIAYNPKRGGRLVETIRESGLVDADWVAIQNMSQDAVARVLSRATIYLDLGHHPGKDRLPREAAAHGAVTILARRGAGGFYADAPIPAEHKVTVDPDYVAASARSLNTVLGDPAGARALQAGYRTAIANERTTFTAEVKRIFLQRQLGVDYDVARPK